MLTNYLYKLRPNISQSDKMDKWLLMLRSAYNWSLADRITQYEQQFILGEYCDIRTRGVAFPISCFVSKNGATGEPWKVRIVDKEGKLKNPRRSAGDIQITALPELKKARPWFDEIDSTVLQQNIKRLDLAYKNFFEGRGFPKFKNRSSFRSFTFAVGVKIQDNKIYFPKIGWMRFYNSRSIPTGFVVKAATIRKRQDGWYASIRIEDKSVPNYIPRPHSQVNSIIGCDLGLTKLVHLSDRHQIDNPRFATNKKIKRTFKIRHRRVNSKKKGSKKRTAAALKVGRLHNKISDKRQAYQWKIANNIGCRRVDAIAIEDLNVAGMMRRCRVKIDKKTGRYLKNGQSRKKALNRAISDAAWTELTLKIEYLAAKLGKVVIKVNPRNSSIECRECGHQDKSNREKERFICTKCGYMEHADIGAAKTIRDRAFEIVRGDSSKLTRPKHCKEISARRNCGKRVEPGNLCEQDIRTAMS